MTRTSLMGLTYDRRRPAQPLPFEAPATPPLPLRAAARPAPERGARPRPPRTVAGDELADARARQKALQQQINDQKKQVAALNAAAGQAPRRDHRHDRRAQGDQRRPQQGPDVDRRRWSSKSTTSRRSTRRSSPSSRRSTPSSSSSRRRSSRSAASCVSARPSSPTASGRLRHRPDLAARDLPVGRLVHRRPVRGELPPRRRRPGPCPRRADQAGPARPWPRSTPRSSRPASRRTRSARRPPSRRGARQAAPRAKAAQEQLKKLEAATAKALSAQKAAYDALAKNKKALAGAMRRAAAAQAQLAAEINEDRRPPAYRPGNIPSQYNGTLQWPMSGGDLRRVRLQLATRATGRATAAPTSQRHRHRRPVRHAGPGRRPRPRRLHRLELRRRRRPGLDRDHRPLARTCRPGTPTCSRLPGRDPAGSAGRRGPGDRLRGQHGALDRVPPALDGRVQRELHEPAAVPLVAPLRRLRDAAPALRRDTRLG